jgi:hypothetical protein
MSIMCRYQKQTEYRFIFINYLCLCDVNCLISEPFVLCYYDHSRFSMHSTVLDLHRRHGPDIAIATTAAKNVG